VVHLRDKIAGIGRPPLGPQLLRSSLLHFYDCGRCTPSANRL